jgi:hypothetical protein
LDAAAASTEALFALVLFSASVTASTSLLRKTAPETSHQRSLSRIGLILELGEIAQAEALQSADQRPIASAQTG